MRSRRAFSFVEVMIAVTIMAIGLLPLLAMYRQQTHVAHFNKLHLMARYRARHVAESLAAFEYDTLVKLAGTVTHTVEGVAIPEGLRGLPIVIPPRDVDLRALSGYDTLPPRLQHFSETMGLYQEGAYFEELSPEGFGRIVVYQAWNVPGQAGAAARRSLRHFVFVSRRENSLFQRRRIEK